MDVSPTDPIEKISKSKALAISNTEMTNSLLIKIANKYKELAYWNTDCIPVGFISQIYLANYAAANRLQISS